MSAAMQISAANLLIAASQGKPAPKTADASQSFSAALAGKTDKTEKPSEDFAPLSFKKVEPPAPESVTPRPATPYGTASPLGSQINIVI